jgi:cystathionine beta-lyase family protein involved in aluminum resistance
MEEVIGMRGTPGHGSLMEWGITYRWGSEALHVWGFSAAFISLPKTADVEGHGSLMEWGITYRCGAYVLPQ